SALSTRIIPPPRRATCAAAARARTPRGRPGFVLLGDLGDVQRPDETELRVVVTEPTLGVGRVELADLVGRPGVVDEYLVPAREEAAVVLAPLQVDQKRAPEPRLRESHRTGLVVVMPTRASDNGTPRHIRSPPCTRSRAAAAARGTSPS